VTNWGDDSRAVPSPNLHYVLRADAKMVCMAHPPTKDSCAKRVESLQATSSNAAYRADFDGYHLIIYYTIPANVLRSLSAFFRETKCDSALA
jgi:hypothetical protein